MMVLRFPRPTASLFICVFTLVNACEQPTEAASVSRANGPCQMRLDGTIEPDDSIRVQSLLDTERPSTLCLISGGGNYAEGLKIIELMLATKKGVATVVDANHECLSACALIVLAGHKTHLSGSVPDRKMHINATLGFHGPSVSNPRYDAERAKEAWRAGVRAIGRLLALDRNDLFPDGLLGLALQKGADEFLKIEDVQAVGAWKIDIFGFKRPQKLTLHMLEQACANYESWYYYGDSGREASFHSKREVVFKNGRFRFLHQGYGDEAVMYCGVDVVDAGPQGPYLSVRFVDWPKDMPRVDNLQKAIRKGDLSGATPLWYIFPHTASLKSLAE